MTQKAQLQSAGDGTAVPSGCVGERIAFTSRVITPNPGGWLATLPIVTLTPGVWLLVTTVRQPNTYTVDLAATLSTNNNSDSTGSLIGGIGWNTFAADQEGGVATAFQRSLEPIYQSVSTNTILYGKVYAGGGNNTPSTTVEGFAVRIA